MANLSPSTVAINTIAHCLANALDVSAGLDMTAAKRANGGSSAKKTKSKRARAEETEVQAKPAKPKNRSRKAEASNGLVTH